jgi:hypothetical protein
MTLYARLEATATRLIAQYGKTATLIRMTVSGPAHDPQIVETPHSVTMVETGYSLTNRNETLVLAGDKLGLISTAGETPQLDDKIEIDGTRYSFVDISPLNPGGTTLIHEFHVRK